MIEYVTLNILPFLQYDFLLFCIKHILKYSAQKEMIFSKPSLIVKLIDAGWFKRLLLRIEFVFRDTHGESHIPQIPKHIRMEIARCLLPDIIAYYESEQGQKEFAEWKAQQEAEKKEKSEVA